MRARRFLILTQYFPPEIGATQTRLGAMVAELARAGHDIQVVTALPNYPTGRIFPEYRRHLSANDSIDGISVRRTWLMPANGAGSGRLLNYASFSATSLFGLFRTRRPDVVFVESPPLSLAVPGVLAARLWGATLILNVADLWPDTIQQLGVMREGPALRGLQRLERWAYRASHFVTAVTDGILRTLAEKGVPNRKLLFLPNGVDINTFRPRPVDRSILDELGIRPVPGSTLVVYAGTMGLIHGLDVALQSLVHLRSEHPAVHLLLVGDGSERARLQDEARRARLENVSFVPAQSLDRLSALLSVADIGLATVRDIPLAESVRSSKVFPVMASAKPVIYSGNGEAARLVEASNAGLTTPPGDPAALAQAMLRLATDKQLSARMGDNGRRYVEENLTWEHLVGDWVNQLSARMAA